MRAFLAVARREIEERRFVFAAAAVTSLVPLAVPLVRGLHGQAALEIRQLLAGVLAATFALGLGLALGATCLASDLADRRIGFYFSRPVSGLALWAGKLGAACVLAFATAALGYAPTLAVDGVSRSESGLPAGAVLAMVAVAAVFASHGAAIAARERSSLLFADLASLVVAGLAAALVVRRIVLASAPEAFFHAVSALPFVVGIALAVGGLVATIRGRTEIRAAHRALSTTLAAGLGLGVVALGGYASWVLSVTPHDLDSVASALPARQGPWAIVQGDARGGEPAFLFEPLGNRHRRVGGSWRWPALSADGAHAAWFEPSSSGDRLDLVTWNLGDPAAQPVQTKLSFASYPQTFLSEHGERIATVEEHLVSVYDASSQSLLASARLDRDHAYYRGFFPDAGHFRLYRVKAPETGGIEILDFDIARKTLVVIGEMAGAEHLMFSASADGDRILLREKTRLTLRDGKTGALKASLAERGPTKSPFGALLSDGRIAVSVVEGNAVRIDVFGPDGRPERTIPIPARDRISLGGEVSPGRLVVAAGGNANVRESRTIFLADLSTGEVIQVAQNLFPVCAFMAFQGDPDSSPAPGSEATRLFYGPGRSLVRFDPLTRERRVILGHEKAR
jgi:hypothetical protein